MCLTTELIYPCFLLLTLTRIDFIQRKSKLLPSHASLHLSKGNPFYSTFFLSILPNFFPVPSFCTSCSPLPGLQGRKRNGSEKGNHALIYVSADSNRIEAASFIPDAPAIMRIGVSTSHFFMLRILHFFFSLSLAFPFSTFHKGSMLRCFPSTPAAAVTGAGWTVRWREIGMEEV